MNSGNGREHADREALRERLSAYLDGELAPADAAALERHLAACAECRDELAGLREVRALLRALPAPRLPRSFALPATAAPHSAAAHAPRPASAPARVPAARLARAAQWVGSLAAVLGLLLIVATAVLGAHPGAASTFSAAPALGSHAPQGAGTSAQHTAGAAPDQTPTRAAVAQGADTPTPTIAEAPAASPTNGPAAPARTPSAYGVEGQPFPVLPVAGAGLLAGGIVLFGAGRLAARQRRQRNR